MSDIFSSPECIRCGRREMWHPDGSCHRFIADDTTVTQCTVPPDGWECSREIGHEGPCAARLTDEGQVEMVNELNGWKCWALAAEKQLDDIYVVLHPK